MRKRTRMYQDAVLGRGASNLESFHTLQPAPGHMELRGQYQLEGALLDASSPQVVISESRFAKIVRSVFG